MTEFNNFLNQKASNPELGPFFDASFPADIFFGFPQGAFAPLISKQGKFLAPNTGPINGFRMV